MIWTREIFIREHYSGICLLLNSSCWSLKLFGDVFFIYPKTGKQPIKVMALQYRIAFCTTSQRRKAGEQYYYYLIGNVLQSQSNLTLSVKKILNLWFSGWWFCVECSTLGLFLIQEYKDFFVYYISGTSVSNMYFFPSEKKKKKKKFLLASLLNGIL